MRFAHALLISGTTATALVLGACDDRREPAEIDPTTGAVPTTGAAVAFAPEVLITELVDEAPQYAGQTVRIAGDVREMLDPQALVLESTGLLGKESVLVLTREPANPMGWMLQSGQHAAALGNVRVLAHGGNGADVATIADIERELGRALSPELRRRVSERPLVVVARAVGRVHGRNIDWTDPTPTAPRPPVPQPSS